MRQTSTQKRNNFRSMIIVALLLLLVAVIGFGGYTLSKFVSEKSSAGTAQVAKWGYTLSADAENLFGKNYEFDTNESVVSTKNAGFTVSSSSDAKLVAPGTTGSMTFSVKGNAEVKAALNINLSDINEIVLNYTKGGVAGTYAPVKWTLTKKGDEANAVTGSLAQVAAKLNKTTTYEAKAEIDEEYTLSWAWAFEDQTNADSDALDTLLGMIANDKNVTANGDYTVAADTSTTISFSLKISVTQLAE